MELEGVMDLGCDIQYMRLAEMSFGASGPYVKKKGYLLDGLRDIHRFLEEEKLATVLLDDLSGWVKRFAKDYPKDDMMITEKDSVELAKFSDKLRKQIGSELNNIHILRVEMQAGLNPNELRKVADKSASVYISSETWKKLTDIEKSDFSDAARCLLLGTATPSVMVALRGAEASIRNFYRCKTKSDPGSKTWRQLTRELKGKATGLGIEDTFVGYLDYIGDAKRNFAQHPNKIYSLREAVFIFMQVVGLVEDIYAQI